VREHTEAIRPPRALWVPFMFGRPLGAPNDAAFQRRVLLSALRLLEATAGPVLEDYPEDAPDSECDEEHTFACPVSFTRQETSGPRGEWRHEIAQLAPWHELARARRRRTTAGVSGLSPQAAARFLTDYISDPSTPVYRQGLDHVAALRLACQDLKAFYMEAVLTQPGARDARAAERWFWEETVAGKALVKLSEMCRRSGDEAVRRFGEKSIIPMAVVNRVR
jgi:hypothetical protein